MLKGFAILSIHFLTAQTLHQARAASQRQIHREDLEKLGEKKEEKQLEIYISFKDNATQHECKTLNSFESNWLTVGAVLQLICNPLKLRHSNLHVEFYEVGHLHFDQGNFFLPSLCHFKLFND